MWRSLSAGKPRPPPPPIWALSETQGACAPFDRVAEQFAEWNTCATLHSTGTESTDVQRRRQTTMNTAVKDQHAASMLANIALHTTTPHLHLCSVQLSVM